jgi:hypothetical protein
MKFKELLENIIDMGTDNKLSEPPERPANKEVLSKRIQDAFKKAGLNVSVKADGAKVELTSNGKTNTFTTSHVMKYINNPKALAEMISKTGYYA